MGRKKEKSLATVFVDEKKKKSCLEKINQVVLRRRRLDVAVAQAREVAAASLPSSVVAAERRACVVALLAAHPADEKRNSVAFVAPVASGTHRWNSASDKATASQCVCALT